MRLTSLLRAVLRSEGEFTTLGRELEVVEAYLDIERARFEQRLRVHIDVPATLRNIRVPPLILQPIVENAVKHGIAQKQIGGEIAIRGTSSVGSATRAAFRSSLRTQAPARPTAALRAGGRAGVGLRNVERRLACQYGDGGLALDPHGARRRNARRDPNAGRDSRSPLRTTASGGDVSARLRVVVADDERPARSFLVSLLRSFADVAVVGEAASGKEARGDDRTGKAGPGVAGLADARARRHRRRADVEEG